MMLHFFLTEKLYLCCNALLEYATCLHRFIPVNLFSATRTKQAPAAELLLPNIVTSGTIPQQQQQLPLQNPVVNVNKQQQQQQSLVQPNPAIPQHHPNTTLPLPPPQGHSAQQQQSPSWNSAQQQSPSWNLSQQQQLPSPVRQPCKVLYICPKCNGLGGWGAKGPCRSNEVGAAGMCPTCNGARATNKFKPCANCGAKGGFVRVQCYKLAICLNSFFNFRTRTAYHEKYTILTTVNLVTCATVIVTSHRKRKRIVFTGSIMWYSYLVSLALLLLLRTV